MTWKFKIIEKTFKETLITIEDKDWEKGYMIASKVYSNLCSTINNFGADYSLSYRTNYSELPDRESGIIF
tara:strand:- start:10334 stop:10543 length:210 start_codon:yes stop_codon:yes gene_type:complete